MFLTRYWGTALLDKFIFLLLNKQENNLSEL